MSRLIYFRESFPLDLERRNLWVKAMKRQNWTPDLNSFVCSDHFEESCLIRDPTDSKPVSLTDNAVPTIFKFNAGESVERHQPPEYQNLEMLSRVCCLVKPIEVGNPENNPEDEALRKKWDRLTELESQLEMCKKKVKMYKKKIKALKKFGATPIIANPHKKSNEDLEENILEDDFDDIMRSYQLSMCNL